MNATDATHSINKKRSRSASTHAIPAKQSRTSTSSRPAQARDYFLHERPFADVKIHFQQHSIWCDKALLAAASPVLCEQLLKLSPKESSLSFDDIQLDEFLLMLEFIYPLFNPEINDENVSTLIRLSHRFQFGSFGQPRRRRRRRAPSCLLEVLKHACRFYVTKYLSTIRHVASKCQHAEAEGDSLVCNHVGESTNENHSLRERELM